MLRFGFVILRTSIGCAALVAVFAMAIAAGRAAATGDEPPGGELEVLIDGVATPLPLLKSDADVTIHGDVARVRLTQLFANPHGVPLHARYVFPLPPNAAVDAMRLVSGNEQIEAEIRRKREARAVYEAAKQRGNSAALLEQHRPNVFTQEVANLMPGAPVSVEIEYAHTVEKRDGVYHFHFPMVVGPRFLPPGGGTQRRGDPERVEVGRWALPASSPVAAPREVDESRVSLHLLLDAGLPIVRAASTTHAVAVERHHETRWEFELADGRTRDDGDFVLQYRLEGEDVGAGVTTHTGPEGGFVSLLIEPPHKVDEAQITPRELVFVLDCSGSMHGVPLSASKRFMRRSLPRLRPSDTFRIIRFSDAASEWTLDPVSATPANVAAGIRYVDSLSGGGGTVMTSGIRTALAPPVPDGALRLVVFLTDGYIGNDVEIVRLIQQQRGEARFFSFGVGNGVNRYLIQEMARVGRGAARIVKPDEDAEAAADELVVRLASPIWTDVEIDWGGAPVHDVTPALIPDLFLGQSLRVLARYDAPGEFDVRLRAKQAGLAVEMPLRMALPETTENEASALPTVWARSLVEDRMVTYLDPSRDAAARDALRDDVTVLGLAHRLVTQWTSFVAVAKPIVNRGGVGVDGDVAVPKVKGVSDLAYPPEALRDGKTPTTLVASAGTALSAGSGFTGNAAPEPGTVAAIVALACAAALARNRSRAARARNRSRAARARRTP